MPEFKDYETIKNIDEALYVLIRFVHTEWDDIDLELDTRKFLMSLYGELMCNIYPEVHDLRKNLELEKEVFFDGDETDSVGK